MKSFKEFFKNQTLYKEKALYQTKTAAVRLKAMPGKYRLVERVDPIKQTPKYFLIPSTIRQLQYENLIEVLTRVQEDEDFVDKWITVTRLTINRKRKTSKNICLLREADTSQKKLAD